MSGAPSQISPTGYRVYKGKKLLEGGELSCPMCPTRFCLCAEAASARAKRAIREEGGRITLVRLPDGAVLSRLDAPVRGKSAKDWSGELPDDDETFDLGESEDEASELQFDEGAALDRDDMPGIDEDDKKERV